MELSGMPGCHLPVKMLAAALLVVLGTQVGPSEAIPMINGTCAGGAMHCKPGMIIPMWLPKDNLSGGDKAARAIVYFVCMVFMFLGVSIIADRFMSAIEVITSKEREVTVKKPNGETQVVTVRIWNETVSNLTLMALGSSAPEILLSIIEIIGNGFEAGDLGPGTIVGSAAFNLFVIIGLCVYVIPDGEVRKIKHLPVFFVTATWSIFAYLWMYLIIAVISPGEVHVWEGVLTFIFFPITVLTAYVADRRIFFNNFLKKKYRSSRGKAVVVTEGDMELGDKSADIFKDLEHEDKEIREFEKHRFEFIEIMRELRKKHPNMDMASLEEMAEVEAMNRGPKSRAFYRIQATRKLTGGGNVIKKKVERKSSLADIKVDLPEDDNITRIFFEPGHYTVMENVGTFNLTVSRMGGNLNNTVYVDYRTEDGTANAGSDYEFAEGTLIFHPGETHKQFSVTIIDDDVFEEDEHFYVRLSNIRVGDAEGMFTDQTNVKAQLANPSMATVMILDDDHAGIFHFELREMTFPESIGEANVKVCRSSGARGCVKVPYRTIDGTAHAEKDYMEAEGELYFEDDQTEEFIKVRIVDDEEYEKNELFYIELGEPRLVRTGGGKDVDEDRPKTEDEINEEDKIAQLGKPRLGDLVQINCHIRESMEFKSTVDKLIKQANLSLVVGTSSWREQFIEAITVSSGDDDEGEEGEEGGGEEKLPSCMDYVMHFLTIFWKILFAFVPPTDYGRGWYAFIASILIIGALTALIGDVAEGFGCSVGLKSSVTAISFVALGTSVPDIWGGWACFVVSIGVIGGLTALIGDVASSFGCTIGLRDSVTAISFVALGTSVPEYLGGWPCFLVSIMAIGVLTALVGDLAASFGCHVNLRDSVTAISFVAMGTSVPDYWGGWACFTVSILMIGLLTGLIGDIASSFGCNIGLRDSVCAISFVALGTSLPDTFASKVAAINDDTADSSIGNVTGSNGVNVFLGIGIAWTIAALKHWFTDTTFKVDPGSLAFSVTVFCVFAFVAILAMVIRRNPLIGGELGGPRTSKIVTSVFFMGLWLGYLLLSAFENYCYIDGF